MDQLKRVAPPVEDVPHLEAQARYDLGRAARKRVPRRSHSVWEPPPRRPDPVSLLEKQAVYRMPDLVPIRYGRMLESPFAYYRGAALAMARDLAHTPWSGLQAQLCGDAHLSNFGVFLSAERTQVFDINDFDETMPGPWEWDVKRLAASFEIGLRDRGATPEQRRQVVLASVRSYRQAMTEFSLMRNVEVWYARLAVPEILADAQKTLRKSDVKTLSATVRKGLNKDSLRAFSKLTVTVDGETRIRSAPPLLTPAEELLTDEEMTRYANAMQVALKAYRESLPDDRRKLLEGYRFAQIARKVVGVGSVGTRSWIMLMIGRDSGDPLFLQMKEARTSVLEPGAGRSEYRHQGQRVVEGQRIMQATSDVMLGWYRVLGFDNKRHDFYVRQLWDGKTSADPAVMPMTWWEPYAEMCGWTLARAHARSGQRLAIAGYLGTGDVFDEAIAEFSAKYADQNERDYEALQAAEKSGRITALHGV